MTVERIVPDIACGSPEDSDWLTGRLSAADTPMIDVLRLVGRFGGLRGHPACQAHVARGRVRPAFEKAHADRMTHDEAADAKRAESTR